MDDSQSHRKTETDAVMHAYAALNRNDISGFLEIFDPAIEWRLPPEWPGGGTFRGFDDVSALLRKSRETWAEGTCEPQRYVVAGDRILLYAHVHVRLKSESEFRDGDIVDVFAFRNGKVIEIRTFGDAEAALKYAGADPSEAG